MAAISRQQSAGAEGAGYPATAKVSERTVPGGTIEETLIAAARSAYKFVAQRHLIFYILRFTFYLSAARCAQHAYRSGVETATFAIVMPMKTITVTSGPSQTRPVLLKNARLKIGSSAIIGMIVSSRLM